MMKQAVRQKAKTGSKQGLTSNQSLAFVRNTVRAAVGELTFLRGLFDDASYGDKLTKMGGTKVHQLPRISPEEAEEVKKDESKLIELGQKMNASPEALRLSLWLETGAFEALEKGYLRSLCIAIYKTGRELRTKGHHGDTIAVDQLQKNKLLEAFIFKFKYPSKGEVAVELEGEGSSKFSATSVANSAFQVVRMLISTLNTMPPLPEERILSMSLHYYDEIVPEGWQPAFFQDSTGMTVHTFAREPTKLKCGTAKSAHHTLALRVASVYTDPDDLSDSESESGEETEAAAAGGGGGGAAGAADSSFASEQAASSSSSSSSSVPAAPSTPPPAPAAPEHVEAALPPAGTKRSSESWRNFIRAEVMRSGNCNITHIDKACKKRLLRAAIIKHMHALVEEGLLISHRIGSQQHFKLADNGAGGGEAGGSAHGGSDSAPAAGRSSPEVNNEARHLFYHAAVWAVLTQSGRYVSSKALDAGMRDLGLVIGRKISDTITKKLEEHGFLMPVAGSTRSKGREVIRTPPIVALARAMQARLAAKGAAPLPKMQELIEALEEEENGSTSSVASGGSDRSGWRQSRAVAAGPGGGFEPGSALSSGVVRSMGKARVSGGAAAPGGSVSSRTTPLQSTVKKSIRQKRKRGDGLGSRSSPSSIESQAAGASPRSRGVASTAEQAVARKRARLF